MSASQQLTNLADMVRDRARTLGNALAYEFEGRQTTFAEFDINTNRVANALIALGVKPGERIAYLGKNSDFYFELLMGAMKAKVVMAPVNWRLAGPEVAFIVADCKAPVLFVGPEFITQVRNIKPQLPDVRHVITTEGGAPEWQDFAAWRDAASGDDPKVPISPKDIAIQLYTSGTTGKPKGAMLSHANFLNLVQAGNEAEKPEWNKWTTRRRLAGGDADLPYRRLRLGRHGARSRRQGRDRARVRSDQDVGFLRAVRDHETVHGAGRDAVRGAAAAGAAGGLLPPEIHALRRLADSGCAAARVHRGVRLRLRAAVRHDRDDRHHRRPSARGPCRGAGAHALRRQGAARRRACDPRPTASRVPPREVGEVATRSGSNMAGYWNLPEATARTIGSDGWLRTGDAGYMDEDGYLFIHDRVKDMIISGGENIYPAEVENAICGHPDVAEVAVIGIPDEKWGEAVKAIVVLKPGKQATATDIINFARERIAGFKAPKSVDFIEALPRNPSGKILRRNCASRIGRGRSGR